MQAAEKINPQRIASKNDLYRIDYCVFQLPGTISLSPRARRYLFFIISLVKVGYSGIAAPMAAIADAIFRTQGQTAGIRTLRSALVELESAGYVCRRRCRTGANCKQAVIDFQLERFVFWTKIRSRNVIPHPTLSHISSCRQNLPADDRRINHRVNNDNSPVTNIKEQRARTRSKKSAKKQKYHPVFYTLLCVIPSSPVRPKMIDLASREISCGSGSQSGVDWSHFTRLWRALDPYPGGGRERTAKREIVPLLYDAVMVADAGGDRLEGGGNRIEVSVSPPSNPDMVEFENRYIPDLSLPAAEKLELEASGGGNSTKTNLCKSRVDHKLKNVNSGIIKSVPGAGAEPAVDLDADELRILLEAKQSIENRR